MEPTDTRHDPLTSVDHITVSTRETGVIARQLALWLADQIPDATEVVVDGARSPDATGMSSETILFTGRWTAPSGPVTQELVARVEPGADALPLFPRYDLESQFRLLELVGAETTVPVPKPLWFESDSSVLGAPFFVMERIDGVTPPDLMPYTFGDSWVSDGSTADLARMQRNVVATVAGIHRINPVDHDLAFLATVPEGTTALEHHLALWDEYHLWAVGDTPSPLLARAFSWLRHNLPDPRNTGPACLSWGDARIGNMLFADFEVMAVLDWEMAGVAPPEVDLGWLTYLHRFFHDIAVDMGLPGMPDFLTPAHVAATYGEITGREPADFGWFQTYAAVRHGVIMRRVTERAVHFGEAAAPDHIDDLIIHRATIASMLDD